MPYNQPVDHIPGEKWKRVVYTRDYFVSDLGRVKKIKSYKTGKQKEHLVAAYKIPHSGKQLVQLTIRKGFRISRYVHEMVLYAFEKKPQDKALIGFRDNDSSNCKLSNLFWAKKKNTKKNDGRKK